MVEGDRFSSRTRTIRRSAAPIALVTDLPESEALMAVVAEPTSSALVIGSTQPEATIDAVRADELGLVRIRRRSGGGGVIVRPGAQLWVDLFIPSGHSLAHADVGRAAQVAGAIWRDALAPLVRGELVVYEGPLVETPWSRTDCYSGLGPGEVLFDGQKLVGVSQRRDRRGTWLFTQAHVTFDPAEHAAIAAIDDGDRVQLAAQLDRDVTVLPIPLAVAERAITEMIDRLPAT